MDNPTSLAPLLAALCAVALILVSQDMKQYRAGFCEDRLFIFDGSLILFWH
jgi:hypothetical protein